MPIELYFLAGILIALLVFLVSIFLLIRQQRGKKAKRKPRSTPGPAASGPPKPGTGKAIRDFFFYTEEEKTAMSGSRESGQKSAAPAPRPTPSVDPLPVAPAPAAPPDATEVMRIWRDVADGSLIIQIGEAYYRTMGDIKAAGHERRFMGALRELARLAKETVNQLTTPPAAPPPEPGPPPPEQPTVDELAVDSPPPPPARQPASEPAADLPPLKWPTPPTETDVETESIGSFFDNVRAAIRTGGKSAQAQPVAPPLSIPEQIDAILQQKLQQAPGFQNRRVVISASASGGVSIEVDGKFYEAVSDIHDDDVRELVMGAIREWEEHE